MEGNVAFTNEMIACHDWKSLQHSLCLTWEVAGSVATSLSKENPPLQWWVKHCVHPTAHDTRRNRNISQHTVKYGTWVKLTHPFRFAQTDDKQMVRRIDKKMHR